VKCVSLKVRIKETETTRNSRHIVLPIEIVPSAAAVCVAARRVSPRHPGGNIFPDVCKKTQKSFIWLLAPLKIYLFIWRCINSFYTRIHEVVGDRALLHVGADAVVAITRQTAVSQRLSIDIQPVAELGGHGQALGIYRQRSLPPLRRRPWSSDPGMVVGLNA